MKRLVCPQCNGEGVRWYITKTFPEGEIMCCRYCRGNGYLYLGEPNDHDQFDIEAAGSADSDTPELK